MFGCAAAVSTARGGGEIKDDCTAAGVDAGRDSVYMSDCVFCIC